MITDTIVGPKVLTTMLFEVIDARFGGVLAVSAIFAVRCHSSSNCRCIHTHELCMCSAHYPVDNPVGIIVGSAVAVVICMLIVCVMITVFVKR